MAGPSAAERALERRLAEELGRPLAATTSEPPAAAPAERALERRLAEELGKHRASALARSSGEAQQRRATAIEAHAEALAKASGSTGPGDVPQAEWDPRVRAAHFEAAERGLPGPPPPEGEDPRLTVRIGDFLRRFAKSAAKYGRGGLGAAILGMDVEESRRVEEEEERRYPPGQMAQPPGPRTVRRPTVLSTGLDVLGTLGRETAALHEVVTGREGPGAFIAALAPPSWSPGQEPLDWGPIYDRYVLAVAGDPSTWGHTVGRLAVMILTDPLSYVSGIGAGKTARSLVGATQATRVVRGALKASGNRAGTLDALTKVAADDIAKAIRQGGLLEAARPLVREVVAKHAGPSAAAEFDTLGRSWGELGLRLGLPFTQGREVVSARTLTRAAEPFRRAARKAEDVIPYLRTVHQAFDPVAEAGLDAGWDGAMELYLRNRILQNAPEHEMRVAMERAAAIAKVAPKASKKAVADMMGMNVEELAWYAGERGAVQGARDFASMVLDAPHRAALDRWRQGILVPTITQADKAIEDVVRRGYTKAVMAAAAPIAKAEAPTIGAIEALAPDVTAAGDAFADYVKAALKERGFADDASEAIAIDVWGRAGEALVRDALDYRTLLARVPDRVQALVDFYGTTTARLVAEQHDITRHFARDAARYAARDARVRGLDKPATRAAVKAAVNRVMAQSQEEIDSYVHHFVTNNKAVRRRGLGQGIAVHGKPAKHRQFLSLVENWEHGQNPATDALVSLAAREYAHVRFKQRAEMARLVLGDRRWAVPVAESRGLTKAAGWDEVAHPFTGDKYAVRAEAFDLFDRAMKMYRDPSALDKMARHYDALQGVWKGFATHARLSFYNMRNMVDDAWRMALGGFSFNLARVHQAMQVGALGRLETTAAVKATVRRARRTPTTAAGKWWRDSADRMGDAWEGTLRKWAAGTERNAAGQAMSRQQLYDEAVRLGVVDKGYVAMDLASSLPEHITAARSWDPSSGLWKKLNPLSGEGFLLAPTGRVARSMENHRRLMLFLDRWHAGETAEEAAQAVRKWLFDYKELTAFERGVARRVAPFYTFLRKNLVAQTEGMIRNPRQYLYPAKAKESLERSADWRFGPVGVVQDYMDDLHAWRLPTQTDEGSPIFWNPGLAMSDVNVLGAGSGEMWDRLTPLWDIATILRGFHPQFGTSLAGEWREPDAFLKAAIRAHNKITPGRWEIPILPRTEGGQTYDVVPAAVVAIYEKAIPNMVAYGRIFAKDKADVFDEEYRPYRQFRELTGQSLLVQNPIKAERYYAQERVESGPLAGPASKPMGTAFGRPE